MIIELFIFIAEWLLEKNFATQSSLYCIHPYKHIPGSTSNILMLLTQKVESTKPCRSQIWVDVKQGQYASCWSIHNTTTLHSLQCLVRSSCDGANKPYSQNPLTGKLTQTKHAHLLQAITTNSINCTFVCTQCNPCLFYRHMHLCTHQASTYPFLSRSPWTNMYLHWLMGQCLVLISGDWRWRCTGCRMK